MNPPQDESELLERARGVAGYQLSEIAAELGRDVPEDLSHAKGWVGALLEERLGASAGNKPVPDFQHLGVELKSLPVDLDGKPFESTYVSMVQLRNPDEATWEESSVCKKLAKVLWIPVLSEKHLPIGDRVVGIPVLWSPDAEQLKQLRKDWTDHMETIREGYTDAIRGTDGTYLQIRPKAANATKKTWTVDEYGNEVMTRPKGFYLRPSFTAEIIRRSLETSRST